MSASAPPDAARYECGWCGRAFREDFGQPACRACPLTRLCGRVRCPHCGWENPARPGWRKSGGRADDGGSPPWWRRVADFFLPSAETPR